MNQNLNMTETRRKLEEAEYFLRVTQLQFNRQQPTFEFNLNAFVNAARNVTFVMQKEFEKVDGFTEWWKVHSAKDDELMSKFVNLRNVSVKEKSIKHSLFNVKHDFGPEGLRIIGLKGPTSVISDPIRFDEPIPTHSYVTVNDDNGERRIRVRVIHDFSVIESYDHGSKQVKFDSFIEEAAAYFLKLEAIVDECESKFVVS